MTPELLFVVLIAAPTLAFLAGVRVASSVRLRELSKSLQNFDEDTRDHRKKTPKMRMTLYRRLIEASRRTRKMPAPPVPERDALVRKYVFLNLEPPPSRHDTVRDLRPPFEEPEQVTLRIRR